MQPRMSPSRPASDLDTPVNHGRAPARALALFLLAVVAFTSSPAQAQNAADAGAALGDPNRCVVVVDDAGNVGLRIADAQSAHEAVVTSLRKRLGTEAVVYEGSRKNAATMKKMLGGSAETQIQDSQLAYYDAAMKAAPWRVKVRFGQKKSEHWITVACRKRSALSDGGGGGGVVGQKGVGPPKENLVEEKRFTGKSFLAAKEAMDKGLPDFCQALPVTATLIPVEGPATGQPAKPGEVPGLRKKELKPWAPPPKR